MKTTTVLILSALLLAGTVRAEDEASDLEALFRAGIELAKVGKHKEALAVYEKILDEAPDATGVLYNAGLAAYLDGQYSISLEHWKRLKGLDPADWQVRAKVIQAYQALGKREERDREIKDLYRLRKETEDDALKKRVSYCRDQFTVGNQRIFAFEHFDLLGDRAVKLWFSVSDKEGKTLYRLTLGSYDKTNQLMRDLKEIDEGERGYHLDGYYDWGHATYRFYKAEPDYDEVRTLVLSILKGDVEPISSSRNPESEPAAEEEDADPDSD